MSGEFELYDRDDYDERDYEPSDVCECSAMHDDLEHAENICSACGLQIVDLFAPIQEASGQKPAQEG